MIIVTGTVVTKPDTHGEILAACLEHVVRSRAEPGCIDHRVRVDCEDANKLVFFEKWSDMAALQVHFRVPESGAFAKLLHDLAAEKPTIEIYAAEEQKMG